MDEEIVHEPRFFLDKELILYLQKNMTIHTVVHTNDKTRTLYTNITIAGELICKAETLILVPDTEQLKSDIGALVYHNQLASKKIKALEDQLNRPL